MKNFYQNLLIICLTVGTIGSLSTNLQAQCPATPANPVVINEVSGDSGQGDGANDAIVELAGIPGTNIGGMVISNSEWAVILPAGTVIPANGVFLIACGSQSPPYGGSPGVGLDVGCTPNVNGLGCAECDFPGLPISFDVCNPANAAYYDPAASGFTLDNAGANDGDQIVLFNANGTIADAVQWGTMGTTTPGSTGGGASGAADNVAVQIGMSYTLGTPGIRGDGGNATGVAVMPLGNCGGTQPTFTMPPISDPRYIPIGANVQGCNTSYQRPVPAAGMPYAGSGTSNGGSVAGATAQWGMLNTNGTNSTSGASTAQFNNANHPNPGLPNNTQAFNWLPPATLVRCTPGTFTFGLNVNNWQHVSGLNCAGGLITTSGATGAESGSTVTVDGTTTAWGSVTPNLATGVTNLSFTTASLSVGTHTVTLKWDDYTNCCSGGECYESITYTVKILPPFVQTKTMISCPTDAVAGNINLSQYFSGGNTPYTYALTSGTGAMLNATSGVISLPTGAAGPFVVTVNETAPACGAPLTITIANNCVAAPPPCPVLNLNTVTTTASGAKCPGDVISLCINTTTSTNLPNGGLIDWYVGNSAAFDPFTSPSSSLVCTSTISSVPGAPSNITASVYISDYLPNPSGTDCGAATTAAENEIISLTNPGSACINIGGFVITGNSGGSPTFTVPAGTTLAAGASISFNTCPQTLGLNNTTTFLANSTFPRTITLTVGGTVVQTVNYSAAASGTTYTVANPLITYNAPSCVASATTTVACCPYTIPLDACNGMPLFFKAIIRNRPLGTAGTPVGMDCTGTTPIATVAAGGYTVTCPTAVLAFTTIEFCRGATPVPTLPVTLTGINAAGFTITYSVNGVNYTTTAVPNGATTYDLMASLLALAPSVFADNPVEIKLVSINPPAGACAGTVSGMANVSIYTAPTVTIGAGPFSLTACSGAGSTVIIPITVGGTPSYPIELNYTINGSPAQAIVTSSPFNLVVSAAGTYIFTSAASSKCTTPIMQTVVVNPAPGSPTLAPIPNQYVCSLAGGIVNLTALNPAVTGLAGGTYTWYFADPNAPEFVPSLQTITTPGGVLVTTNRTFWVQYIDMNGCKAVASVNIILTTPPAFTLSETPATCSVPTAIINFTAPVANPVGATYSYSYTTCGTAYNVGSVAPQATPTAFASASANPAVTMISGAVQGVVYWVRVRNNLTGCFSDQMITTSQVTICCPVIGSSIVPASVCVGNSFSVSAAGLDDMANAQNFEQNFGISFVYSLGATAPANAYMGGTLLGTVPFASLTGADPNQMAALSGVGAALAAGTYQICAILAPTPTATTCRPQVCKTLVINPNPTATNTTLVVCDDNTDGLAVFTLTNANTAVLAGQTGVTVTYHATAANATANTAPLASPYTNITANSQIIFVRVTNSITGCFATGQVTLTVNPLPAFTLVGAAPTCPSLNNATITFTLTSAPATNYTYFVSQAATCAACPTVIPGGALPAGWGAATGASAPVIALTFTFTAGSAAIPFTVRMFDETTGCYFDQTVSITPPAACFACPVIGSSIVPANICAGNNFNVSAAGLDDMANAQNQETNFGISFVYSLGATAPANAYIGGTSLGTVPFSSLTGADPNQMAALNGVGGALAAGTYQVCAILAPTPTAVTCRPQVCKTIVINPNPTLSITQPASVCAPSGVNLSTVVLGQSPTGGTVTFHATATDATAGINPLSGAAVTNATVTTFVRYQLATGCFVTGIITISQTSQLTITAVAECAAGVSNSYNIRVTSVTGGNGGPYTVSITGQPNQTFSGTALVFGPFAHSGTGTAVQTVTATMNVAPSCAASIEVLETLCPQAINNCSCTNGAVPASSGTILVESQPGTFVAFGTSGYTQTYLLVNAAGVIINSNNTGLFTGLANGTYSVYALNFRNTDAALINPKIANGQPISGIAPNGTIVGACYSISTAVVRTINCNTIASAVVPATICSGAAFSLTTTHSLNPGNLTIVYNTGPVLTQAQLYDAITTGNETVLLTPVVPTGTSTTVAGLTVPAVAAVTTYHLYVIYAAGQCSGASCSAGSNCMQFATVDLVVNPTPTVTAPANQVVCNGSMTTAVIFAGTVTGTTYDWTNNTPSIGLAASGTGNIAPFTATNATAAPVTATITVTPKTTSGGVTCPGTPVTFTITVNPTPTVTAPANQVVCSGATTTAVIFAGAVTGTIYDWTNNTPSIGLAASGTGNIPAFTATNATAASVTATITVTPKTTSGGVTCPGTPITFTITVNPTPTVTAPANQVVCNGSMTTAVIFAGAVTGTTYDWTNNTPSIGLAASGTGNIPAFTATNATAAPVTATITVTPKTTSGGVTCPGTPITFTITVNPTPTVTAPANQVVCSGAMTTAVIFAGVVTGTIYDWTNNTPSIGLAASGTGNIPAFTATNVTAAPVTATITVTPKTTSGGVTCTGTPITFTITVNPTPTVTAPANQVVCSGAMTTAVIFAGAVTGTTYDWTNNTPSIGLAASGTGNIPAFTATNATVAPVIATITVTPKTTSGGVTCTGTPVTFTITVNPTPVLTVVSNPSICSGSAAQVDVSSNSAGTTITWTAVLQSGTATGFASQATPIAVTPSGVVDISQILTNTSSTAIAVVRYTITPVAGNCPGAPIVVDVTINPSPIITVQPRDTIICMNGAATFFATATGLNLMLQWQASGNAGATWFNLTNGPIFSGVTTNTLSISNTTGLNGFIFRLVATTGGSSCSTFSNAARLRFHVSVPITCNNSLQISLDANCQALVTPDMILNGDYYDSYGVYQVIITTANGTPVPNPLTGAYIGQMLTVSIKDRCDGNSCWGMIKLEDKLAPVLVCPANITIGCDSLYEPGAPRILFPNGLVLGTTVQPIAGQPNFYTVSAGLDNCGGATLWYNDVVVVTNCQTGNTKIITRTWYARDASGNVSTPCTQTITLRRTSINDVIVPPNYTGLAGANAPLSCDGTKSISQPTYTVQNFTTTMTLTAHGAWQQVCGGSTPVVVSNVPVVTYVCRDTAFYIDANGLIIRSYLVPVVNNPLPADTIFWAKLPNGNPAPTPVTTQTVNGIRVMGTGEPSGIGCGTINYTYSDLRFDNVCGTSSSSFKILRVWKIVDWCTGAIRTYEQTIKVLDTKAPEITCPANVTVSTDAGTCSATYTFAAPTMTDNCDAAPKYDVSLPTSLTGIAVRNTPIGVVPATYSNIPQGIYPAVYTATDACGNTSTCSINISVEDLMPPNPICREFTQIALGFNGQSKVLAKIFDAGSTDNCGIIKFQASRDYQTGCSGTTAFQDTVMFTCCDLGDTVNVTLRVYDRFNNQPTAGPNRFNDCMVQVFVEDKLPPVVSCPPSFTVDCGQYDFTNNNIGGTAYQAYFNTYFGSVQKTEAARISRNVNVINAAGFAVILSVKDGIAYDNCSVNTITDVLGSTLTNCGVGTLTRTFTVSDKNGRTATCAQQITVVNKKPFNGNTDITWPSDINITNRCNANVHPDTINSRPRVREDGCDITAVTYTDEVFTVTGTFCQKILRKWKVLDWCQYNPSNPSAIYIWEKTQTINITNTIAPTIAAGICKDTVFCQTPSNCASLPISLSISATDDCTPTADIRYSYSFDINNDGGALILGNGNTFTGTYPFGTHRISWSAEDGCGNVRTCSYKVTIDECKKPTPICKIIIAELMPATSMVAISTVQVNNTSYDNCAVQYIKLRRVAQGLIPGVPATRIPEPPAPTGNKVADKIALNNWALTNLVNSPINADTAIFTCLDRKFGGGMGNVQLWVGDNKGNWDFCQTGVILQNNMGAPDCGEPAPNNNSAVIAGEVHTELNAMVQDVQIKVASPNNPILSAVTSVTGIFNFQNLLAGANYTVTPEKDINPLNGVTTYDLVLIQKHILGVAPLGSPYKIIAADVNRNGGVSTIDMVELRKMILRIDEVFANNTSWRFVKADYQFPDPSNPWTEQFPEISAFSNSGASMTSNFVGVKIGDVNMSATPNNLLGTEEHGKVGTALFEVNDVAVQSGETFQVGVKSKDLKNLQGYQFALNFDARMMEFVDVMSNCKEITKENFGLSFLNEGIITTSWNGKSANLSPESVLFTLSFKAKSNLRLSDVLSVSSKYTVAEAYTLGGELLDVAFAFANSNNNTTIAKEKFELYQNQPNPFKGKTVIGFNLPKADQARLVIYDNAGRLIKEIKGDFAKGYNEVTLDESDLKGAGVLEYRLETSDNFAVKRMIILE